ncbi:ubiquitin-like small modifier protein 1 [Methanoculleus chikugoensis]|uniref:Molybdopterin synthase sulfur carrier subunit n=1 Tax=Methanoculleus chikugoensis TaxID=118126 RepID=A0ABN5XK45_9EURY|nr:ubiquitin-like small modifier protein 1 [Methanoculleus chikugoensis]BBL68338.1 molybdopterin synthase sulfur carrier subunit [Methanoculleus chikugoensis]
MKIRVKAFARFREILGSGLTLDLPDGTTMAAVLATLRERAGDEGDAIFDETGVLRAHVILMRNGKRIGKIDRDALVLADGDEIALFPPVAGG